MKLLFGYTAKAMASAGLSLPNALTGVWQQLGNSPFLIFQSSTNVMSFTGSEFQINIGYSTIFGRSFDVLGKLTADEVLTWGFRYRGSFNSVSTAVLASLLVNDPRQHLTAVQWADCQTADISSTRDIFVEVTADPVARTLTGFVNGKKVRTTPIPDTVLWNEVHLGFLNPLVSTSANKLVSHFYAGIFKKSEGVTHLTAWECEDLPEVSSELRDGDGVLNRNTVNEVWKSVVFSTPTTPADAVAIDAQALNPQLYSTLLTDLTDGTSSTTASISTFGEEGLGTEFGDTINGRRVAAINPAPQATQLTLKLKALPPQE